jgi:D-amino-acid dehydrogenase
VPGLWCAFGHGHQGFTLGPVTGELLAAMMMGETPKVDVRPFSPGRFA